MAAFALATAGTLPSPVAAAISEPGIQLLNDVATASGKRLTAEKLKNKDANQIERRAENDRDFNLLKEYFSHDDGRGWRQHGRDAYRIRKGGERVRDAFWITMRNPDGDQWVHVMYAREGNGKDNSAGLLWRGDGKKGKFTNRFYVQNGNIRNDNGRVEGADVSAQAVPDDLDQIFCPIATKGPCVVGTAAIAAACFVPLVGLVECTTGSVAAAACYEVSGSANEACKKLDGS